MGVEALTRVFEYATHDGMELLVLIALANIADPAGVCWPGHVYLGLYARVKHERNLRQYLRALERTGNIYASKVGHRNQKAMYLVATAMSAEEIAQVLAHSFDLYPDDAQTIAAEMVERQLQAEAQFALPLSELRKNKRTSGGQKRRISRSANERGIGRSANERGIRRSANERGIDRSAKERRISRSANERGVERSSLEQGGGSPDPRRRIVRSGKPDPGINLIGRSAATGRRQSSPDPIMIQQDPNHDPPPPAQRKTQLGGGGGPSATTLYLQEATDINAMVTEEVGDLPLDRVKALVAQKRRAGAQDGGIVIALRALRERLQREAVAIVAPGEDAHTATIARVAEIKARAIEIAPPDADDLDLQWLMVYLEEGASDEEALHTLAERHAHTREVNEGTNDARRKTERWSVTTGAKPP
jgi:hypothetical protein